MSAALKTSRRRLWLKRLLLVSVSALIGLVVIEFTLGAFFYSNVERLNDKLFDEELGWRLVEGEYSIKAPESVSRHTIHVNSLGLRSEEVELEPREGTRRILVIGDSFTYGVIAREEQVFTSQLERKLNAGSSPGASPGAYEVLNAGVPGYGTAQQMLWLKRLHNAGLRASTYLVCMYTNDILDNLRLDYGTLVQNTIQPGFEVAPDGALVQVHAPEKELKVRENNAFVSVRRDKHVFKTLAILRTRLELFAQTRPGLIRLAQTLGMPVYPARLPGVINAWYEGDHERAGFELTKALLAEIKKEVESHGGELLVCLIPSPVQVYPDTYRPLVEAGFPGQASVAAFFEDRLRPQRSVRGICDELKLPFLDLYEPMSTFEGPSLYVPREGHFSPIGHEVAAECMRGFLLDHE
jgi:hypothetical protein